MDKCEICSSIDFMTIATRIREGEGHIVQCKACGLVMQDLEWEKDDFVSYYDGEYQQTNSFEQGEKQSAEEHFNDRLKTIDVLFRQVKPLLKENMSVLEIGCGAGALMSMVKPYVDKCIGIELNSGFVDFINKKLAMTAYFEDVNKIDFKEKFDLILMIDTLDHLPNPFETLQTVNSLLKDDGIFYLEVPNRNEALNLYIPPPHEDAYQTFFWHRAHMFYFTKSTISSIFEKAGFTAKVSSRHNYTLKNFLNWYYTGSPQKSFVTGLNDSDFFIGDSEFGKTMNKVMASAEKEFKSIAAETFTGDTLCCIAKKIRK